LNEQKEYTRKKLINEIFCGMIYDIGIVDTKKVIAAIKEIYNLDFTNFALTAFKRRLLYVLNENNYSSIVDFISNIENNQLLFEQYLSQGLIDTTELFRDPSCWRDLRDKYIKDLYKNRDFKILVPGISSGDDLYTLLILLKEEGMLDHAKVTALSLSDIRIRQVQNGGLYDMKKIEIGEANYKRFSDKASLSEYYTLEGTKAKMHEELLKNVTFNKYSFLQEEALQGFHLVLYRNRLIYLNPNLQDTLVAKLVKSTLLGGIVCVGGKETLEISSSFAKLTTLNAEERIYKKRSE
jgi:chemotaxis protein methyltransferase CheR